MEFHSQGAYQVLRRFTWTDQAEADKLRAAGPEAARRIVAWQDGSLVEAVDLYDPSTGEILTATVDQTVNGECSQGALGRAAVVHSVQKVGRPGTDRTFDKHKFRVVAFDAIGAGKNAERAAA